MKILILTGSILLGALLIKPDNADRWAVLQEKHAGDSVLLAGMHLFLAGGIGKELPVEHLKPKDLIQAAKKYVGTPHCFGGSDMQCMDCSGLLKAAFRDIGIVVPHGSQEMARFGEIILDTNDLKKGDLLFFIRTYSTDKLITHSAIYAGRGQFIHTSSKNGVEIRHIDDYAIWKENFFFATRIFGYDEE